MSGESKCLNCDYEWVAVAPVGTVSFECPKCSTFKGVWFGIALPQKPVWECECGCHHFFITPSHAYCCHCGLAQEFGDYN